MQKQHPLKIFKASWGLSTYQLAKKFNRTPVTIDNWFNDRSSPTQKDYFELRHHFNEQIVSDLFNDYIKWLQDKESKID